MPTFECNGLIDPKNMKVHKMNFNSNKIIYILNDTKQ